MTAERILGRLNPNIETRTPVGANSSLFPEIQDSGNFTTLLNLPNVVEETVLYNVLEPSRANSERISDSPSTADLDNSSNSNYSSSHGFEYFKQRTFKFKETRAVKQMSTHLRKFTKYFMGFAGDSSIPILEDIGKQGATTFQRVHAFLCFITCLLSTSILCWYLRAQTISNPINEGVMGVPVSMGPFPAVAVYTGGMLRADFLAEIIRKFEEETVNSSYEATNGNNVSDNNTMVALAYIVGQLLYLEDEIKYKSYLTVVENFLTLQANQSEYAPTNDVDDPAVKAAAAAIKSGMRKCSEVLMNCKFASERENCDNLFATTMTGKGIGCVYNAVPTSGIEKKATLRTILSNKPITRFGNQYWKSLDMDKIAFSDKEHGTKLQEQFYGGERNGVSFEISDAAVNSSFNGFKVAFQNPRDTFVHRLPEYQLSYGHYHLLKLDANSQHASPDIRTVPEEKRNCRFYAEKDIGVQVGYTYSRCLEDFTAFMRDCSILSEPIHGMQLCHPTLLKKQKVWIEDDDRLYLNMYKPCRKSCNEIRYPAFPNSHPIQEILTTRDFSKHGVAEVRIFFPNDEVEVKIKTLRRFIAEEIGIILGMLGFCNDITLPKIYYLLIKLTNHIWTTLRGKLTGDRVVIIE